MSEAQNNTQAASIVALDRLFGVVGAETLWDDPAAAYEQQIEAYADEHDRRPVVIEEWTVHPPRDHLRSAADIVDWLLECAADDMVAEDWSEAMEQHSRDPEVLAAAETLLDTLAARATYRMADKRVAEHTITWDDAGEPLYDGEPLYRAASDG